MTSPRAFVQREGKEPRLEFEHGLSCPFFETIIVSSSVHSDNGDLLKTSRKHNENRTASLGEIYQLELSMQRTQRNPSHPEYILNLRDLTSFNLNYIAHHTDLTTPQPCSDLNHPMPNLQLTRCVI